LGLIAYGHRNKSDCSDVETLLTIENTSKNELISAIENIKPLGKTPLAASMSIAINQISEFDTKATVVLITDGIESCNGDICRVVAKAKENGVQLKLHIVGFGLKAEETESLRCAAKAGDGNYFDAANADGLASALQQVSDLTIDEPDGNLAVLVTKDGQALDANIEAYAIGNDTRIDFKRSYADTTYLYLPAGRYDLKIWFLVIFSG